MKTHNISKVGLYTFWASFIIGNIFMFGYLLGVSIQSDDLSWYSAIFGWLYLPVATAINLIILLGLLICGIADEEKRRKYFNGIGIMLINIPLALLYAYIGLALIGGGLFWDFQGFIEIVFFQQKF